MKTFRIVSRVYVWLRKSGQENRETEHKVKVDVVKAKKGCMRTM